MIAVDGSTWEERMAQRTKARRARNPELHEDPHHTHKRHFHGNTVICECGEFMGIFSIAITEDTPPLPDICPDCGRSMNYMGERR